jgi:Xaa-Pro aminopeptidase
MTYLQEKAAPKTSHDTKTPQKLIAFMMTQWAPQKRALPKPIAAAAAHARRRAALGALFPGESLVIPTGHEQTRSNDTVYRFRPGSDFFWLTGNLEPDCVLVLKPDEDGFHHAHLFVEPNPGRTNATFFTDRKKGELWVGPRLGVEQSKARFGVDEVLGLDQLPGFLKDLPRSRVVRGLSPAVDQALAPIDDGTRDKALPQAISELRLIKDAAEIRELQKVIASTQRGFEDVIRSLKPGRTERHVEGVFNLRARVEGNDVGYGTIAASGANACILHWTRNDAVVKTGQLLLVDAGVEGHQLYTADITRTIPVSGRFSPAQREIYTLVCRAQTAAFKAVKPGNDFMEPNRHAMRVLAEGLIALGILRSPLEEALKDDAQLYKRWTLHNVSHMLGLDVHDCAKAREQVYRHGPLQPGMVLTIEPGLYFQPDDLTVPARYRGIGVRIEDDVLVTPKGMKNLSGSIPREAADVEKWVQRIKRTRAT